MSYMYMYYHIPSHHQRLLVHKVLLQGVGVTLRGSEPATVNFLEDKALRA